MEKRNIKEDIKNFQNWGMESNKKQLDIFTGLYIIEKENIWTDPEYYEGTKLKKYCEGAFKDLLSDVFKFGSIRYSNMKTMKTRQLVLKWSFLLLVLAAAGCGYRLAGKDNPLLSGIHTVAVPYFKNETFEAGIESVFTGAFADEFIQSKRLQVVSVDRADVILRGTVKNVREEILSYNKDDKAMEYRIHVTLDLALEKRDSGEILWKRKRLKHSEEYQVSSDIMVTETGKNTALEKVAKDLARRVEESIIQGF